MTTEPTLSRQNISSKYKLSIVVAIIFPCLSRLLLQGSGAEHEMFRYLAPCLLGGTTGYWAGHLLDQWQRALRLSRITNNRLKKKIQEQKVLRGIIPICSHCRRIRNPDGDWSVIEEYIQHRSEARFSHGLCPNCAQQYYPTLYELEKN
ncbi:hypothetical protein [Desulfocastanea catecholica]